MSSAGRMLRPFVKKHAWSVTGAALSTVALTAASLASPWPLKLVIDELLTDRVRPFALTGGDLLFLSLIACLTLAIALVRAVAEYYSDVWLNRSGEQIVHDLRVALYEHLQRLSLKFHDGQKKGNLVTRITGDVNSVGGLFSESLGEIVSATLLLGGMAIVSFAIDPLLGLATLGLSPALFFVTSHNHRRHTHLARRQRAEEGEIASLADEALGAIQVVKAFGSERFEHSRVESLSRSRQSIGVMLSRTEARFTGLVDVIGAIAAALVMVVGVFRVAAGELTPGDLVVFTSYASKTYKPMRDIARQLGKISQALARADRVAEILEADTQLEDRPGAYRGGRAAGNVELKDVSFAYEPGRPIVKGLSLKISAGSHIAIIGPSGAGKSTLGALVARFYDPEAGAVAIDRRDARDCSLAWLREQVGFLLQDTVLFSGTVSANIAYATEASPEEVIAAARVAQAHDFISELPAGYDTELGPRGVGLSGGQRQRIGIARVLLRDPPILVLDEPTTGLDAASETLVIDGLFALMRGRTTIVISHSTALARMADRLLVLENGKVVKDGPPKELLEGGGSSERPARNPQSSHRDAAPLVPRDPALPQMGRLLDLDNMAAVLGRSLRDELRAAPLDDLQVARVRYDPQRRVMVHYRAVIGGDQHHAVATALADQDLAAKVRKPHYTRMATAVDGRSPGAHPVVHDGDIDAIVAWLPFDVKLPGVATPTIDLVHRLTKAGIDTPPRDEDPALLGYKPAARAVLRFGDKVLKAYGKERQFDAAVNGLVGSGRAASLCTAPFHGALPELRLTVQGAVEGITPGAAVEPAREAGAVVRLLQGQRIEGLVDATPRQQLREAARHASVAGVVVPELRDRLQDLIDRLGKALPIDPPLAPAHGDFHVDQLIVHDGRLVVIDFDGLCRAPAALDIATYAADVVRGRGDDVRRIEAVMDPLLEGYGVRPPCMAWYLCTAVLVRATHPFRAQAPRWPERVAAMVTAAEEALTL